MREHALISGLDCHEYPAQYEKIGSFAFVDRHFKSHKEITIKSVEEKLLSMSAWGDRLRMAVLYFLGTVIKAKGKYIASFSSFIIRVVNNVEDCKTFPWGRLPFYDDIWSINHVMKQLKGKPKKNVSFLGEGVDGCLSRCPRMCKKRFQSNIMKGYPLEDLYNALGKTTVINSVLVPTVDEEPLMGHIMDGEPDYENEEGPNNLWSTWLTIKGKSIWWPDLFELDVAAREFTKKKDKEKMREEASSSNHGLEDVLKALEDRLMTCLSEVSVKVEKMDKRLSVIEKSQEVLKRGNAKKVETIDGRIDGIEKEMKELKEKERENNEGFDYQDMDFDWDMTHGTEQKEPVDAEMVEDTEVVEELEGQRAEETDK
ncbi:uncharacterized protein At3g43530-like [Brassica napus]|uniref:uncharacterized protein At3g43530-like n=1 Tax=Brassica napus TaxID=3708 RepID=UPI00207A98FD|nr:uncharacterized protein At3g43530-like [Brassica napus]